MVDGNMAQKDNINAEDVKKVREYSPPTGGTWEWGDTTSKHALNGSLLFSSSLHMLCSPKLTSIFSTSSNFYVLCFMFYVLCFYVLYYCMF